MIFEKALANTLMNKLLSMKIASNKSVREHIIEIRNITVQLRSLEVAFLESLTQFVFDSLRAVYVPFKISCNTQVKMVDQ